MNLIENDFNLAVSLYEPSSNQMIEMPPEYGKFKVERVQGSNQQITNSVPLDFHKCTDEDFPI